jgi:twitching motility protein PilU
MKAYGKLVPMTDKALPQGYTRKIANQVMNEDQRKEFEEKLEMNLALMEEGVGRFRVNIFVQRNEVSLVCRHIVTELPDYRKLGLPEILPELMMSKMGSSCLLAEQA